MVNKPRVIGTKQESKLRDVMNDYAGEKVCERVVQHGSHDHGDLRILVDDLVLTGESKHKKTYPSEGLLEDFKKQTVKENENARQDGGVLFVNLPNKAIQRAECWMQRRTYLLLLGTDNIIKRFESEHDRKLLTRLLEERGQEWVRLTLLDFMRLCWGNPAWGRK